MCGARYLSRPQACSLLLNTLLDSLSQFALAAKTVLPLATGGTKAHALAIDYALQPVLTALGALQVVQGYFVLDTGIVVDGLTQALTGDEVRTRAS